MQRPTVFIARKIPSSGVELLQSVADVRMHQLPMPPTRTQLLEGVRGCAGILSLLSDRIDAEVFDAAGDQLRVVSNFAVGYNNIDVAEAHRRGIAVGNTPDVLTDATADIAVALILAAARRLREGWQSVIDGGWKTWEHWVGLGWTCVAKRSGSSAWDALVPPQPSDWCVDGTCNCCILHARPSPRWISNCADSMSS